MDWLDKIAAARGRSGSAARQGGDPVRTTQRQRGAATQAAGRQQSKGTQRRDDWLSRIDAQRGSAGQSLIQAAEAEQNRLREEALRLQRERELRQFGDQPASPSAGAGVQAPAVYQPSAFASSYKAAIEAAQNKYGKTTRPLWDRDSDFQGKVAEQAVSGMEQAAKDQNPSLYAQHLQAYYNAAGNIQKNQQEALDKLREESPAEYYAYTMSAEQISKKAEEAKAAYNQAVRDYNSAASLSNAGYASMAPSYQTDLKAGSVHDQQRRNRAETIAAAEKKRDDAEAAVAQYERALSLKEETDRWKEYIYETENDPEYAEKASTGRRLFDDDWKEYEGQGVIGSGNSSTHTHSSGLTLGGHGGGILDTGKPHSKYEDMSAFDRLFHIDDIPQDELKWYEKVMKVLGQIGNESTDTTLPMGTMQASINAMRQGVGMDEMQSMRGRLTELDEDLQERFYYFYAKGPAAAQNFLEYAQQTQKSRDLDELRSWSKEHPVLGTIAAAGANVISGADFLSVLAEKAATGEIGAHQPDIYISEARDLMHEGVSSNLDSDVQKFLYQVGTSMLDSGIAMATGNTIPQFFLSAAASAYLETKARGASDEQALAYGFLSGLAECVFEEVSVEKLLSQDTSKALQAFLKQSFTEASEEITTSLANTVSDLLLSRAYNFETKVEARARELTEQGMSPEEAKKQARKEWVFEVLQDGLAGAVSGGGMTAIHIAGAKVSRSVTMANIERAGQRNAETMTAEEIGKELEYIQAAAAQSRRAGNSEYAVQLLQYAKGLRQGMETAANMQTEAGAAEAQQSGQADAEVPGVDFDDGSRYENGGQIARATDQDDIEETRAVYEQTRQKFAEQARDLDDTTLQTMAENVEENLAETRDGAAPSELAVMEGQRDALREEIRLREAVNRNGERMQAAIRGTEVPGVGWRDGSELERIGRADSSAARDGGPVPYGGQNNIEGNGGQIARATGETGGQIARATGKTGGQIARATEPEGLNYGTETESAADGGQRDAGLGTRGQAGSLGEGAGGQVTRGGRGRKIVELLAHVKAVGAEKTSSARLEGLRGGTNNNSIYLLTEDMLTDSLREQVEKKAEEGIELRFTLNPIEVRDELGQVHGVNGVQITTADGRQIEYVQANSRKYSPEQIVAHEDFHAMLARNPALKRQLIDWLYSNHTEQEISSMVAAYARATRGIYDGKENAVELYFEDMLADFASQMERGDRDAAVARETAGKAFNDFSGEIENARQNRAGDFNGETEERYSSGETVTDYEGKDLSKDSSIYDYDFLIKQKDMQIVRLPSLGAIKIEGEINRRHIADLGIENAKKVGVTIDDKVYIKNLYTNRNLRVDVESIRHGLKGDFYRLATNSKLGACIGDLTQNAIPINGLKNSKDNVAGTYAMASISSDDEGREIVGILTVEQRTGEVLSFEYFDVVHAINGRIRGTKKGSQASTKLQGVDPIKTTAISIADLLRIVNEVDQSILSDDVLEKLQVKREPKGTYTDKVLFSASEENDGVDFLDGSELEDETPPHPSPAATPSPQGEGSGGQIARATETGERIATGPEGPRNDNARTENGGPMRASAPTETGETDSSTSLRSAQNDNERMAREKKIELAERTGIDGLKSRIKNEEKKLEAIKTAEKMGLIAEDKRNETKARKKDIQESIDIYRAELEKKTDAKKADKADKEKQAEKRRQQREEKKARKKEAALKADKPKQSKYEFRQDALNLFSVPAAKRQTLGNILNSFADKVTARRSVSEADRAELFRQLYEAGVEIAGPADDTMQDIRDFVKSGRIYVPQEVRNEFGDDWIAFNQQAWGNRIYFTRDVNDRGADSWNAELAEVFPGSFDAGETDARTILENIVELAEEGKGEHVTIAEMMRRNQAETGVTVDQQMDELESKLDRLIDTFAQKAKIESKTAKRGMMQLVRERQYNREQVERQAERKREIEKRNEVMKQIQKLQRMRKRVSPDFQGQIDELIGRLDPDGSVGIKGMYGVIDAQARSISAKGLEDLPALARQYEEYKKAKGEDFLPNAAVEKRINRLKEIQLDSLTLDDVITLGEAVSGLVTQIQNENKLLADKRHGAVSASAGKIDTEVKASKGKMFGEKFWAGEMLDMPRYLQHLAGWLRGGEGERFAKLLEKATEYESAYISGADALFDEFKKNKENRDWLKKATGRHAESIEIKVPVDIGKDANGNTAVEWQTFEITPMMRVALLMHSRNYENLRHIAETGIQIPKLDDFRKEKMKDALSGVDPVRMAPSTVKAIVKKCTPQERAFADVLAAYFDVYAKERINNVSLILDGFYRANVEHYFPIDSARDYLGGGNDYVAFDRSLESIGSLKERKNGINPIVLGDALDIASRHMTTFARYTAFAIPMRDFNEVFGYVFHEEGKPFAGSVMHTIGKKFGPSGPDSIKQIQAALAQQNPASDKVLMKTLRKIRRRIASTSLSGNVRVMASQFASLPYALPYLGAQDLLASFVNPVDTKVRDIYSPISQFRRGGYINQELGDLKSEHPLLNSIPVVMTGITDVDTFTINRLWSAAVNKVYRTTELKPGSREQVLSGNDDFYKAVAEIYTEAVYKTQPNYTTVQRPALLRDSNDLVRSLFMYKTVPFQVYGMLYEATGRLANDQARYNANKSTENKENLKASRKFYAKTQAAVLIGSTLYVAIRALIGGGLFREKKYRDDEEGKMTLESVAKALGRDLIDTYAGSFVGASELLAIIDKATGNSSYNNKIFNDISSLGEIEKAANVLINSYKAITEKDWRQGKKAIKDAAQEISVLGFGFPAKNIEKFLLSTTKWIAPEWADRYENYFDEYERGDLDEESERFLKASLRVLMDNRTDGLKDETIDELTRLWASDQTAQIPSAIQTSYTINGEDVELTAAQRETYREKWGKIVSEYLEPLMASDAYEAADDKGKAKLISQLYEYARQQAAAEVAGSEPDPWVLFGQTCEEAGIPLNEYLAVRSTTRKDLQNMDGEALDSAIRGQMEFRVGELDEKTLDELAQLFADGGVNALPPDVPDDVSVDGETVKFSQEERVAWLQSFKRTAGENLEALMASKTYAEADEEGKVKLISGLYEVARAAASMELAPGYSPHKWITTGLAAAEKGVPLDEYVAFHYLANAESKDKDQIQILMKQDWTDSQKETVWTGWLADEGQMRKYESLKNGGASWTDAMGVMDIGGDATEGLTEAQAAVYQQKWDSITGKATKALMQTKAYRDANNEGKEAFVDKLNTYASAVARAEALKTTPKDSWVTAGMAAEKEGVSLEKYIVFTVQLGKLNGKDDKGETVDGLLNQRSLDLLNKTGWTDKQKETVYLKSGMTDDSKEEKVKALREAGLTWEQTSSVMRSLGKEAEHARAITATNATEDVKLKALEVYLTESQYKSAKACRAYNIKLDTWLQAKVDADANSNDRVTQEEAEDYIDGLNIGWEEKAYLWQLLCPSQKNAYGKYPDTWKKNPYSTTLGREVWEFIYGD